MSIPIASEIDIRSLFYSLRNPPQSRPHSVTRPLTRIWGQLFFLFLPLLVVVLLVLDGIVMDSHSGLGLSSDLMHSLEIDCLFHGWPARNKVYESLGTVSRLCIKSEDLNVNLKDPPEDYT
ncbi:hypothetical protein RHMOL_Rhmol03G0101000 [Rhododendron molle]|uniref:Uncharacterized protein n=1 Tax=Rhododendron molle TaxID=49168 RepID=A0ACC0PDN2_RHOML|nr:hypothetical protein RHMOL_Rhmol03G0101000 [Rhododendron molle]